jgi:hypothetical protein
MSYEIAKTCFEENLQLIGEPSLDPKMFNLSSGLFNLTQQIEDDVSEINRKLDVLIAALQRR